MGRNDNAMEGRKRIEMRSEVERKKMEKRTKRRKEERN